MYTNTSPEKIRECLFKAGMTAINVKPVAAYPPLAATLFQAQILGLGLFEIMDRMPTFDYLIAQSDRRAGSRNYFHFSHRLKSWIVRIPIFLDRSANNAE